MFSFHSVVAKAMTSSRDFSMPFVFTEKLLPYLWDAEHAPWKVPAGIQAWLVVDNGECLKESLLSVVCSVGTLGTLPPKSECLFLGVTIFEAKIKFGGQIRWMILEKQNTWIIRIWEGSFWRTFVQVLILKKTSTSSRVTTTLCNYFWVIHLVVCCALFQQLKPRVRNSRVTA